MISETYENSDVRYELITVGGQKKGMTWLRLEKSGTLHREDGIWLGF